MADYTYAVYYGTFIHLPLLPEQSATPTSPPKHKLSINHGALWVSQPDGKIAGTDWEVKDEAGLGELIKRMGWRVEGEREGDGAGAGELVRIVKSRKQRNGFFFPGFIDSHIHAPQYPNSGIFGSSTLLDWLETYTFPLESSFGNKDNPSEAPQSAHTAYNRVVSKTLSHGTTCAAYFATIHVPATNLLATICHTKGQRALVGRVCMDNHDLCPDYYRDNSTASSLAATKATIAHIHTLDPSSTLIRPIITPRFAPSCTPAALSQLGALAASTSPPTPIQTHISENLNEISLVAELFPTAKSYADVYDSAGLLTPHTILAHAVHLSADERALVAARRSAVAHCPASNSAIGSGLCPVRELLDDGITVGLGTDVSGGWSPSILEAVRQACLVSRLVRFGNTSAAAAGGTGNGREKISVEEGLYLATRGGARVVGLQDVIGGFEVGMYWDAQMVEIGEQVDACGDCSRGGNTSNVDVFGWESWEEKIAKWVWNGDDRNVKAVWVAGRLVHGDRNNIESAMESKKPFRVLIVGGGISGLSLANMLQEESIEFLLLEAYPDIAPQVGASIGFQPHGLRILDQLGMYQDFCRQVTVVNQFDMRGDKGELLASFPDIENGFVQRHGYPLIFLERQLALKIFYSHLDKSKVLTGKAVCNVALLHDGVTVTTKDGSVYSGDIVVGCDGIHSEVRREMVRLANEASPGYFPSREYDDMPCDYGCVFGISKLPTPIPAGCFTSAPRHNNSYGILGGLHGHVYWFHFFKLQKPAYGAGIPRFTKEDELRHIEKHKSDILAPGLSFEDLIRGHIVYNMTALPEYTFQQWHYNRLITIGDAAHKFHPIAGHGGNSALESGVALTNALARALKGSTSNALSNSQISDIFQGVQNLRHKTVKRLIAVSHTHQRVQCLESPFARFFTLHLLPRLHVDRVLDNNSQFCPQAQMLENVALPHQPRLVPFDSDILNPPYRRGWYGWALASFFLALSAIRFGMVDVWDTTERASGSVENANMVPSLGIEFLYKALSSSLPRHETVNRMLAPSQCILHLYFVISLFPMVAIYTIESVRKRNSLNLLTFTSFWAILYQVFGIAIIGPLYYIAYILTSSNTNYWWPVSRQVPTSYAKALLPALLLGYLLPTLLFSYHGYSGRRLAEVMSLIWKPAPIYVNIILSLLSTVYAKGYPDSPRTPPADKPMPDLPFLNRVYLLVFNVAALTHFFTLSAALAPSYPGISIVDIFIPLAIGSLELPSVPETRTRTLWLVDFGVFWIATTVWCVLAVWDMNRVGRARVNIGVAVGAIMMGTVAVGPGATAATVWYWREEKMAKVLFKKVRGDKLK
ncbi:hypothetical protein BDBG_17831 [Blastomyces gilchristii SLH14081]|uniref:Probable guanine deaminase n=1 Tax=Blastomyces gilchristii (strain SLH14081) TaxID=559298 RepID=A0A179V216_BLAGS|nr:uncharacterized protein BDBG_17831 [Blastomyces gilchristii SLH14081]OAT13499.1 hypothetical protein BDBG_17831 [Blastomyces gilchristii SLH14081]